MRIVINSRQRVDILKRCTLKLFPRADVCVAASEVEAYSALVPRARIIAHPDSVSGMGPKRQWVVDNVPDEIVVMVADDITTCWCLVGPTVRRLANPDAIEQLVATTAQCAVDAGVRLFGFNQAKTPAKFNPMRPFSINGWVDGVVGYIGKDLHFDQKLLLHEDVDFALERLLKDRIIWKDERFGFQHDRYQMAGGNAINRSAAQHVFELQRMKRRWGRYLLIEQRKHVTRLATRVRRS